MQNHVTSCTDGGLAPRQTRFVPAKPRPDAVDKYRLLADLRWMAPELGLKAPTLGVLAALCSFHPDKLIDETVVIFAGNAALSKRLHGMPESTLRRHLTHLIKAGLIARRDSPNRKRYACSAGSDQIAFGFSLAPFVQAAVMIAARADDLQKDAACRHLRLHELKARLALVPMECEALPRLKNLCRLTPTDARLDEITAALDSLSPTIPTQEMSAAAAQNEGHSKSINYNNSSLDDIGQVPVSDKTIPNQNKTEAPIPPLSEVLRTYEAAFIFAQAEPRCWGDVIRLAYDLRPALGLSRQDWDSAVEVLGPYTATLIILKLTIKASDVVHMPSYARAVLKKNMRLRLN